MEPDVNSASAREVRPQMEAGVTAVSTPGETAVLPVTVYAPGSPLRNPGRMIREMFRDLGLARELAWRLFLRDLKAQYRNSLLGYIWVFIPPLMAALPFIYLNSQGIVTVGATPVAYGVYAMTGTIIWQVFVDALNSPLKNVSAARSMLTRINFPREAILLAALLQIGFGFLVRLILLVGVFVWFGVVPAPTVPLFLLGVVGLVLTGFTLGLILTPVGLLYGDVAQTLPVITTVLMLLTPVLYPIPADGLAAMVSSLNPLTPLVVATRDWLLLGNTTHAAGFMIISSAALLALLFGWLLYRIALPHLIARLGN
jgi:lipopolysaccharide transport system permease protein